MANAEDAALAPSPARSGPPESTDADDAAALIEEDSLVEEVSIDGMCGVY